MPKMAAPAVMPVQGKSWECLQRMRGCDQKEVRAKLAPHTHPTSRSATTADRGSSLVFGHRHDRTSDAITGALQHFHHLPEIRPVGDASTGDD